MTKFSPVTLVFCLPLLAGLVGCSSSGDDAENESITVFAAASLKKTFTEIGEQFKTDNPGVVYITDALAAGDKVAAVDFVESSVAANANPIAVLKDAPKPDLGKKFVDLVTGESGQKVLSEAGFAKP